jgi:hypothetical protein
MSFGSNGVDQVCSLRKMPTQLRLAKLGVNSANSAILHRLSGSNEMVRNARKHNFWVEWTGPGALVAKFSDVTSFIELVR